MEIEGGEGLGRAPLLQAPLARMLRPLVRLCIKTGITFPALIDLLRELYVQVAERDFVLPGKEQTDSRVSLLTGVHRKEVRRLRGAGTPVSSVPGAVSRTSRILAHWLASPEFCEVDGRPRALERTGDDTDRPSFEALVAAVTRDLRPRAVLDEWIDSGLVTIDSDDRIVLRESAYVPASGTEQQLYYFGRNIHDHMAAAVENVLGEAPTFFERAVHYDGLSEPLARSLEARARYLATETLQAANRDAHASCATDAGGTWRWNLGVYVYREMTDAKGRPS